MNPWVIVALAVGIAIWGLLLWTLIWAVQSATRMHEPALEEARIQREGFLRFLGRVRDLLRQRAISERRE